MCVCVCSRQAVCQQALCELMQSSIVSAIRSHEYIARATAIFEQKGIHIEIAFTTPGFLRNGCMLDLLIAYADRRSLGKCGRLDARAVLVQLRMVVDGGDHTDHVVAVIWAKNSKHGYITDAFCASACTVTRESLDHCAGGKCTGLVTAREIKIIQVCTQFMHTRPIQTCQTRATARRSPLASRPSLSSSLSRRLYLAETRVCARRQ